MASAAPAASDAKVAELTDMVKGMREELEKLRKTVAILTNDLDEEVCGRGMHLCLCGQFDFFCIYSYIYKCKCK